MSKRLIGILTYHDGINYGAFLQAYALSNYIKSCGLNVEIINYKNVRHWFNEYRCVLRTKNPYLLLRMLSKVIVFKKCQSLLPMGRFIFNSSKIANKKYDTVVVGSDEIWNYLQPIVGYDLTYFGENLNAKRLISYAASFGVIKDEGTTIPPEIISLILKFDRISVRDSNSLSISEKIGRKDAIITIDPVFLIDMPINTKNLKDKEFILIYAAGLSPDLQEEVRSYGRKIGKEIISIGYMNKWCDKNIIAVDPFTWLGYFRNASYIITSMFHGAMISIKFGKQFGILIDPYRINKFKGIIERLELTHRIRNKDMTLENILESQIDFSHVNALLQAVIEDSKGYLNQALYY